MTYNRIVFIMMSVCALQFARVIVPSAQPCMATTYGPSQASDSCGDVDPIIVLDRIVDAAYGVLLVGLEEKEVIVPFEPRCVTPLSGDHVLSFRGSRDVDDGIEQKQTTLQQRGSGLSVAE